MSAILIFLLKTLSHLPIAALNAISTVLKYVLQDVLRYRRTVIQDNLLRSFPEKSAQERNRIMRKYYSYLSDLIVETLYSNRLSRASLLQRVTFQDDSILRAVDQQGKKCIIMMGHSGNWEWAGLATAASFKFLMMPVYRRIKDPSMDAYMFSIRSRFGAVPVLDKDTFQKATELSNPHAFALLADQTPGKKKGWWLPFLGQPTPFYRGGEVLARRFDYEVVFAHVDRVKRGHYRIRLERFEGDTKETGSITIAFAHFLERQIHAQPENWLWSHKRWKHSPDEGSTWISQV